MQRACFCVLSIDIILYLYSCIFIYIYIILFGCQLLRASAVPKLRLLSAAEIPDPGWKHKSVLKRVIINYTQVD